MNRFVCVAVTCSILVLLAPSCADREMVKVAGDEREDVVDSLSRMEGPEGEEKFREIVDMGKEVVPLLIEALGNPDDDVAEAAAGCLGEIKDERAVPHLVRYLESGRNRRYAAAWALGEIGDPSSVFPLVRALEDDHEGVVKSSTRAIIKLGKPVIPVLIDAMDDGTARKREALLIAFEDIGDTRAEEAVIEVLKGGSERALRIRAARALAKCGTEKSFSPLMEALREEDVDMKVACAWSLGILEAREAESLLRQMLGHGDSDVREWSARALENITGTRVFYRNARGEMVLPYSLYR